MHGREVAAGSRTPNQSTVHWKRCKRVATNAGNSKLYSEYYVVTDESFNETSEIKARWIAVVTVLLRMIIVAEGKALFSFPHIECG